MKIKVIKQERGKMEYYALVKKNIMKITFFVSIFILFSCSDDESNPASTGSPAHETGTVTDIEGNTYKTIKIGDQWWMAENLKVSTYRNGDEIPRVLYDDYWGNLTTGACCAPSGMASNIATYGRLYNWYAVNDSRKIAPEGWHVASNAEWETMVNYLGGYDVAGGKMKQKGTMTWANPNKGATDASGFCVLPAGSRSHDGHFYGLTEWAHFWTSTMINSTDARKWDLYFNSTKCLSHESQKIYGYSVRCVMN